MPGSTVQLLTSEDSDIVDGTESEDESGLELEADESPEIEVPFDPTKIDIIVKAMTIGSLENRLENGELDLTPDFQRQANVWNIKRKARLIESILLRIPLPSFYFSEDDDGTYAVVDGLQRLCAVFHFMKPDALAKATGARLPPLKLQELQYLKELNGKTFDELDRKFQRRISELEITANIIRASTPPAVKFNVFARLNQGGMPLNAQEIRNAIFPGQWRKKIRSLASTDVFKKATEGKIRTERQQDAELILRFIALWQLTPLFKRRPNQTLDEFLNSVVEEQFPLWTENKWAEAERAFVYSVEAAKTIFGRHVFRKSSGNQRRSPINRGLFEAQSLVCGVLSQEEVETLHNRKDLVSQAFADSLENNEDFSRSLLYATGSAGASNTRIKVISEIFIKVFDAKLPTS
ncbi:DUF262 domain-containing protein [Burkholderia gladioli]|uniref:DUF262 domain-containing protein n=1 Tax=Burkholderia gladioli TaxID=28095 RepID=UPI00164136B5|nr:DUF262 domain-containing protein [Burkholderia gladioli]